MPDIGQPAPPLDLKDQDGEAFSLESIRGESAAVVYFYPKDFTPGCTAESCSFRDAYEDFSEAGAVVIGVSSDDQASHQRFAAEHRLPFTLLSDEDSKAAEAWGVKRSMAGLMPGRETYVVDKHGVIRHRFRSQINAKKHVREALQVISKLGDAST